MHPRRLFLGCSLLLLGGCSAWNPWKVRSQSPEETKPEEPRWKLVADLAVGHGMYPVNIEGIGLITGLKGTGSDPKPSLERSMLMGEMQTRGIKNPNAVLASGDTSVVWVRGILRPGIQEGDHFDLEVRIPSRSETTSLRGGWLLETRLKEMAVLNNEMHSGHAVAIGQGSILVDPSADAKNKDDRVRLCRGRVLGGGVAMKARPLALILKPEQKSVFNSAKIEHAVNKRFTITKKGIKSGVAKAETDQIVKLELHPRYKDNIDRYMQIVRAVALKESEAERIERLKVLETQLLDPITCARAALQLEAVGRPGIDVLRKGIRSPDAEVRFRSAEALAYLDDGESAVPLAEAARQEPAFRVFALAALGSMNDLSSYEQLRELLNVPSVETRYGAFRALWTMNPNDPLVLGERLNDFSYHVLNTSGPPLIHVTRSRRAEVVLFGMEHRFHGSMALEAGNHILVTSNKPGEVSVSKFVVDQPDQKRVVSDRVDDVVRAIVDLGGNYPDVVQVLQQAKAAGVLSSRFEIDALPEAGRTYRRRSSDDPADDPAWGEDRPNDEVAATGKKDAGKTGDEGEKVGPVKSFFARMTGRGSHGSAKE